MNVICFHLVCLFTVMKQAPRGLRRRTSRPSPGAVTSPQVQRVKRKRQVSGQYREQQRKSRSGFPGQELGLRISDKYLLAMVLAYFKRAGLKTEEYRKYFFATLFLASQEEEEKITFMMEIYPWALGWTLRQERRNTLLTKMGFQALVDRATCDMIMVEDPTHWTWMSNRKEHNGWTIHRRNIEEYRIRGPGSSPLSCSLCNAPMNYRIQWEVVGNIICREDLQEESVTIMKVLVPYTSSS
ncbi:speedy protein 1-A-like isoform X2 [Mixophyes fleayi]|uniref:speedy protein 1-A-like isoform X2 n=1 Tax=Mixophyes fleayi TaxID=3061075 RepID=UPI003F4DAB60